MAVAGVIAVGADAAPTGHEIVDTVERALFAAAFALAVGRARRWVWLVTSCTLAILGGVPTGLLGLAAGAVSVGVLRDERRSRPAGAVVGVLTATAALRLPAWGPNGTTAAVVLLLFVLASVSTYRHLRSASRRRLRRAAIGFGIVGAVVVGLGGFALWAGKQDVQTAVWRSRQAVERTRDGQAEEAVQAVESAERRFQSAARRLDGLVGLGGRLVPVLSQQLDALERLSERGAELSAAAAEVARLVDYRALQREDGSVDLVMLRSFAPPLERTSTELEATEAAARSLTSPWLLPPVRAGVEDAAEQLARLRPSAAVAADMARVTPAILGADGERRYLVLFMSPSEARELGGHIGFYAEVSASEGRLRRVRSGPIRELLRLSNPPAPLVQERYPAAFIEAEPNRFPQNLGATPDLALTARAAAELYPQLGGGPIDGVATIDPRGIAALMELTGPVAIPGTDVRLTAGMVEDFLLRGQYLRFPDGDAQEAFGRSLLDELVDRLAARPVVEPKRLAAVLGDAAAEDRLRFTSLGSDGAEAVVLDRLGLGDSPTAPEPGGDGLSVLVSNQGPNKLDAYLDRNVTYRPVVDTATGLVDARLTVRLTNRVPDGLPPEVTGTGYGGPVGTNRVRLAVLSPFDIVDVTVDGVSAPFGSQAEGILNRYSRTVDVAPGATVQVEFLLAGAVAPDAPYRVRWNHHPGATDPAVTIVAAERGGRVWPCSTVDATRSTTVRCEGARRK